MDDNDDDSDAPYPHITQVTPGLQGGFIKPTSRLLQQLHHGAFGNNSESFDFAETANAGTTNLQDEEDSKYRYESQNEVDKLLPAGDLAHGIILAMDALHKKCARLKYNRSIVLLSDAVHRGMVDFQQMLFAIDMLRDELQCPIYVVGLDFPTKHALACTTFEPEVLDHHKSQSDPMRAAVMSSSSSGGGHKNNTIHQVSTRS